MRECDGCTSCCELPIIQELEKPQNTLCDHANAGCDIYATRPQQCRGFTCLWMTEPSLSDDLKPDKIGLYFEPYWEERMVIVSVDPARPNAWQKAPAYSLILKMLEDGYMVWVLVGSDKNLLLPEGETENHAWQMAQHAWRRKWLPQLTQLTSTT